MHENETDHRPPAALSDDIISAWGLPREHASLMARACATFGINPDPAAKELLNYRLAADPELLERPSIVLVTGGGVRLRYPIDDATERTLRYNVFMAFKVNKTTRERTEVPLPRDLRLPIHHRTGIPPERFGG